MGRCPIANLNRYPICTWQQCTKSGNACAQQHCQNDLLKHISAKIMQKKCCIMHASWRLKKW